MPKAKVLIPQGLVVGESRLPCPWAILTTENGTLDVFLLSRGELEQDTIVEFETVANCRVGEKADGGISDVFLGTVVGEDFSGRERKAFEAKVGKFLHRNYKIHSWTNAEKALHLLKTEYNISVGNKRNL